MQRYEWIAVVPGEKLEPPDQKTQVIHAHGFAAILAAKPQPIITLPKSRKDVLSTAAKTQAQLETLMASGPVLPVAPRTMIDAAAVPATLGANAPLLQDLTNWLHGAVQFQITVAWQAASAMDHFRDAPELAPLFEAGHVDALGLDRAMSRLITRLRHDMRGMLEPVVTDVIALPTSAEVLLNLCVLLPGKEEGKLDRCIAAIDALWSEGLSIRQIGPSPATAFALLQLTQVGGPQVQQARQVLGLFAGQGQDIATARREALMAPNAQVHTIRHAAEVLEADARAGGNPFSLMQVQTLDQGSTSMDRAAVA